MPEAEVIEGRRQPRYGPGCLHFAGNGRRVYGGSADRGRRAGDRSGRTHSRLKGDRGAGVPAPLDDR